MAAKVYFIINRLTFVEMNTALIFTMRAFFMKIDYLLLVVVLISCNNLTPTQRAEKTIKEHLANELNDAASYEPVETKLDSFYAGYFKSAEGKKLWKEFRDADSSSVDMLSNNYKPMTIEEIAVQKKRIDTINARAERFHKVFYGWQAQHKYRAKNALGALVLSFDTFYLNRQFQIMDPDTITIQ